MKRKQKLLVGASLATLLIVLGCGQAMVDEEAPAEEAQGQQVPMFEVDPMWPKNLPDHWLMGPTIGVDVDSQNHIWVVHRNTPDQFVARTEIGMVQDPPLAECCQPGDPVLEFDQEGNLVGSWGGPGTETSDEYVWPLSNHGITIDHMDNVWIGGNGDDDGLVLKFSRDGTFLLQIGTLGETGDSHDTARLHSPADIGVDPDANEVYIADGYTNRRVIVFDADTGEYKRHWGAYGRAPDDGPLDPYDQNGEPSPIFGDTVHCVTISNEGLVYVCDRMNHRLQIFQKDGTFVTEGFIGRDTAGASVWDIDFSQDDAQEFIINADGGNHLLWMVRREELETIDTLGRRGRNAGQFESPHSLAVDSSGNMYVGETLDGRRMQKFVPIR